MLDRLKPLAGLAGLGSFAALCGAWFFQYVIGLAPCAMCFWQRYPHWAAFLIGLAVLALRGPAGALHRALCWAGALAAATTAGLGLYHTGVERKWWPGPSSCTGGGLSVGDDLLSTDAPTIVLCDQSAGEFLWLSMPSWNALVSLLLVAIWLRAATRRA